MDYLKYKDYLCHYGVKGMQKGVRRFTNDDGTLNEAGKQRYYENYGMEQPKSKKIVTAAGLAALGAGTLVGIKLLKNKKTSDSPQFASRAAAIASARKKENLKVAGLTIVGGLIPTLGTLAKYKKSKTEEGSGFENNLKSKDPEIRRKSWGQLATRGALGALGGFAVGTLIKKKPEQIVKENPDNYTYNKIKRIKKPDIQINQFGATINNAVQLNRKY